MAALALPIALLVGLVAELVSGLLTWALGGEKAWWRGVSGLGADARRLIRDREPDGRVSVVEAGGALAALFGAGMAAAGALDAGPDGLVLLFLALALALAGTAVVRSAGDQGGSRTEVVLADLALALGFGVMFLRYGALELEAVRGTQDILGTGLVLGPVATAIGLAGAAKAFAWGTAVNLPRPAAEPPIASGSGILVRLCRWSLIGATSLVAGVLLAGGGVDPAREAIPLAVAALGVAVGVGIADAILRRLTDRWRLIVAVVAFAFAAGAAGLVVLS